MNISVDLEGEWKINYPITWDLNVANKYRTSKVISCDLWPRFYNLLCYQAEYYIYSGASFQLFLGRPIFFYFSMPPDYWKIGKSALYMQQFDVIHSSLLSFFSFFLFFSFLFILSFFLFFFFLPSPPPSNDSPVYTTTFFISNNNVRIFSTSRHRYTTYFQLYQTEYSVHIRNFLIVGMVKTHRRCYIVAI